MDAYIRRISLEYLNTLVGLPLIYAQKSPDTELYDFGFGKLVKAVNYGGNEREIATHILHILCRFKVIRRNCEQQVDRFLEDTPREVFNMKIKHLMGKTVKRVAISCKNDLWLDFGNHWVVFATHENSEESWRYFTSEIHDPHLVASAYWLDLEGTEMSSPPDEAQ